MKTTGSSIIANITNVMTVVLRWLLPMVDLHRLFAAISAAPPKMHILNRLLPRILPITRSGCLTKSTAEIEVKSSGRLVTAARITPPMNAPDRSVFLSIRST